jgi:hypothetical protein
LIPAVVGGAASGATSEIMRESFNAGPVETIAASSVVGTVVTVAAVTLATGVVPGMVAIGALFAASVVFSICDYFLF